MKGYLKKNISMEKRLCKLCTLLLIVCAIGWSIVYFDGSLTKIAYAAENEVQGRLITLDGDAKAYSMMNNTSEVAAEFKKGDAVYVINENERWYEIFYQGRSLYIYLGGSGSTLKQSSEALDTEEVAAEIEHQSQIDKAWIESYLEQLKAIRNARIWRGIILTVIVALVGVITFKSIHNKDEGQEADG